MPTISKQSKCPPLTNDGGKKAIDVNFVNQQNSKSERQFCCPAIVNFNTTKPYQEIRPEHKPRRIFNGFFPQRIRTGNCVYSNRLRQQEQEFVWEEIPSEPSPPANTQPSHERPVYSPVSQHSSSANRYLSPSPTPTWSHHKVSADLKPRMDTQRAASSLRSGNPSPWIIRYKLKQKSNSMLSLSHMKDEAQSQALKPHFRVYSR